MNWMGKDSDDKAGWLAVVMQATAQDAMVQMGKFAAAIYLGALSECLTPAQAKNATEAAIAGIIRAGASQRDSEQE